MSDTRRVISDLFRVISDPAGANPKKGKRMSTAVQNAFEYLNALQQHEYRGWGDTTTAARDRAARKAGITPAQAERVWKRWQTMKSINADIYLALRNAYEATCLKIENAADAIEREAQEIEASHAVVESHTSPNGGVAEASEGAEGEAMT